MRSVLEGATELSGVQGNLKFSFPIHSKCGRVAFYSEKKKAACFKKKVDQIKSIRCGRLSRVRWSFEIGLFTKVTVLFLCLRQCFVKGTYVFALVSLCHRDILQVFQPETTQNKAK